MIYTQKIKDDCSFVVNVFNATIYGHTHQNTCFRFRPSDYGFKVGDNVSKEWVLSNLNRLKKHIVPNSNTQVSFPGFKE